MSIITAVAGDGREFVAVDYAYGWGGVLNHGWYIGEIVDGSIVVRFGCPGGKDIAQQWMDAGGDEIAAHVDHRAATYPNGSTTAADKPKGKARRKAKAASKRRPREVSQVAAERLTEAASRVSDLAK